MSSDPRYNRPYGKTLAAIAIFRACVGASILAGSYWELSNLGWAPIVLFVAAQLSDQIDGQIARRLSVPTLVGYLQDAISDKVLTIGCLLAISRTIPYIDLLLFLLICREFLVLSARLIVRGDGDFVQSARYISITYYLFLRSSILSFLISFLNQTGPMQELFTQIGYSSLIFSLFFGWLSVFICIHEMPSI